MSKWTEIRDAEQAEIAMQCARGSYQRSLLAGSESLSGSTLRGKARSWGGRYAMSRRNLLDRCRRAGVKVSEARGPHGRRVLVIG